ncbi:MAG: HNH endonuclease [Bdellovibrionaceae bacterium]|nr:HNH endonuclease [Pseudobdellovibrionaceae bacterium]
MDFFIKASEEHQRKEKAKAYDLRKSQWWRQQVGPGVCYHCGQKFPKEAMTMDHLIPISRGGFSNKKNCVPSCKECNTKKSYKTTFEVALEGLEKT